MKRLFLSILVCGIIPISLAQTRRYVDINASVSGNALSWATACSDLQLIINNSNSGDTIWVAQGTYVPIRQANNLTVIDSNNRTNAFVLKSNVKIFGGFTGIETALTQRDWKNNSTILSGDIGILNDSTDNCFHVVISSGNTGNTCLDGFIVSGGNANGIATISIAGYPVSHQDGGGIYLCHSSAAIRNITIRNNRADRNGGGILCSNESILQLSNLTIYENRAASGGGLANMDASSLSLINSLIRNNHAEYGGGVFNIGVTSILTNTTITENMVTAGGGGVYTQGSLVIFTTIVQIRNSILWNNKRGSTIDNSVSSFTTYSQSLVGGISAPGVILETNPLFVNPADKDYRLSPCSPMIDAGKNDFYSPDSIPNLSETTIDLDNNPRFYNAGIIDLGAYEYQGTFVTPPYATIKNDTVICNGEPANITFTMTGSPNWDIVYTKDNGTSYDTLKNIATSPYILTDSLTSTTTYRLRSVDNHICDVVSLSGRTTITVLPYPTLDNVLESDTLCDGEQTVPIVFTGQANQIEWTATGTVRAFPVGKQTGNINSYTVENKTSYPMISSISVLPKVVQSGIVCEGLTQSFDIIVSPTTVIELLTCEKNVFCEGEEMEMNISASGYLLSYQWFKNDVAISGETTNRYFVPKVSLLENGQYFVKVTGYCGEQASNIIAIRTNSNKIGILIEKWNDVILVDNSSEEYVAYQWYRDGNILPNATNQFYQELGGLKGCYSVELRRNDGKKEFSCERCFDKTTKTLSIYPNPIKQNEPIQIVYFDENKDNKEHLSVHLYTMGGKLLKSKQLNYGKHEIDTYGLAPGIYLLQLTTSNNQTQNKKIVVY